MNLSFDEFKRSIFISKDDKYAFLLGAGCSTSSGIQSAQDCIWEWKKMIFQTNNNISSEWIDNYKNKKNQDIIQSWLDAQGRYPKKDSNEEYSFYAEECFPIDDDRRKYFQSICSNAQPSIGYKAIALLAKIGFVDTVWTTNFDDLMRDACINQKFQAIDISLDNTTRIITRPQNSKELPIIKLHGDFKYGKLKNTDKELREQDEVFRNKFVEYLKDKHLIVFGYSGRDASLMEILKEFYSQKGGGRLYWCGYRENKNEIVSQLISTANRTEQRAFYVSTDGFDNSIYQIAQLILKKDENLYKDFQVLVEAENTNVKFVPFNLITKKASTLLKSNCFPIKFPKEVYVFEHNISGRPWEFLNKNVLFNEKISAIPISNQIWSLGKADDIVQVFGSYIKGKLIRKPITEITNRHNNLIYLFLSSLCKYFSVQNASKLKTNNKRKIWNVEKYFIIKGQKVYNAIRLDIEIIDEHYFLTLNPDFYIENYSKKNEIGLEYFHKIWNKDFNNYIMDWRKILFSDVQKIEFPNNSNSGFVFEINNNPRFTVIDNLTTKYNENIDIKNIENITIYKGVKFKEPNLIFSSKNNNLKCYEPHPIKGLVNYSPLETKSNSFLNKEIKVSVICASGYEHRFFDFLQKLNNRISVSKKENYIMDYKGFQETYNVGLNIPNINSDDWKLVNNVDLCGDFKNISNYIKDMICSEIIKISNCSSQRIILIFIPNEWSRYTSYSNEKEYFDLHDYIKAFCAEKGLTTQFITEETLLNEVQFCQIIWWLSLSLYVKSFRTPWLVENSTNETAFAGIGYSIDKYNDNHIILGCSHIYSSNGEGLKYKLSKLSSDKIKWRDKKPHLSYDDAYDFGRTIINLFYESMREMPKRVVIHKRTFFTEEEKKGICDSLLENVKIESVDLVEINFEENIKYISSKNKNGEIELDGFPIKRGTCIQLSDNSALLWTHGTISSTNNPNFNFYPGGRYIPKPLKIIRHFGSSSLEQISTEILGLSKMNWNTLNMYSQLPATIFSSNEIARIGKLVDNIGTSEYDYRYFI